MSLMDFLKRPFWGGTIGDYIGFLAFAIAGIVLSRILAKGIAFVAGRVFVREDVKKNRPLFRSLIRKPVQGLILTLFLFVAFNFVEGPLSQIEILHFKRKTQVPGFTPARLVNHLFTMMAVIYVTLLVSHLMEYIYQVMLDHAKAKEEREREQLLPMMRDVSNIILWTISLFSLLGIVFHVNIPALITGLGIGGVALALAAKESIENLLASFTILADKPFVLGDTIKMGAIEGRVERIGFRSTRVRDKDGIELIIPNKKLIDESVENRSGRDKFKFKLVVPLRYNLSEEQLQKLVASLKEVMKGKKELQGQAEITLASYDEKSVKLNIVYHLPDDFTDPQIQAFKDQLNFDIYASVLPAMQMVGRLEPED